MQICQVLLNCLNFLLKLIEISFQFSDLLFLGLEAPLKVSIVSAAFTTAITITAAAAPLT
jgi:hypothetical protein